MSQRILPGPNELRDLYIKQGLSGIEIAKRFNCSAPAVYGQLSRHGIKKGRNAHWLDAKRPKVPDKEILIFLIEEKGFAIGDLARTYNVSSRTARKWCNEMGIDCPTIEQTPVIKKYLLHLLYSKKAFSVAEIAGILGTSEHVVSKNMDLHEIPRRSTGRIKGVSGKRKFD